LRELETWWECNPRAMEQPSILRTQQPIRRTCGNTMLKEVEDRILTIRAEHKTPIRDFVSMSDQGEGRLCHDVIGRDRCRDEHKNASKSTPWLIASRRAGSSHNAVFSFIYHPSRLWTGEGPVNCHAENQQRTTDKHPPKISPKAELYRLTCKLPLVSAEKSQGTIPNESR
jgi:hypothetical protein